MTLHTQHTFGADMASLQQSRWLRRLGVSPTSAEANFFSAAVRIFPASGACKSGQCQSCLHLQTPMCQ